MSGSTDDPWPDAQVRATVHVTAWSYEDDFDPDHRLETPSGDWLWAWVWMPAAIAQRCGAEELEAYILDDPLEDDETLPPHIVWRALLNAGAQTAPCGSTIWTAGVPA